MNDSLSANENFIHEMANNNFLAYLISFCFGFKVITKMTWEVIKRKFRERRSSE